MGGGSAHCYLPFPRDKGIQGLLTSGFSQKDTIPGFPLQPLQTWLEEFQAMCLVVSTKNLHPFSVSVASTVDSDCNQTHDSLQCCLNRGQTLDRDVILCPNISYSKMLHLAQRLVKSSLSGSLDIGFR